ncbi:MAG: hypothetical protein JO168_10055 [Solirubrobacterales bacterium]|nr:hypothetical protein [Solirubrobacterales bacterium]
MAVIRSPAGVVTIPGERRVTVTSTRPGHRLGAGLALAGIVLVGFNLRPAVVSVPPIYTQIARSFPVSTAGRSMMGTLPVLCFALFGTLAPSLARRVGLECSLAVAMAMVCAGALGRAYVSHSMVVFGLLSVLSPAGWGSGTCSCHPPSCTTSRVTLAR